MKEEFTVDSLCGGSRLDVYLSLKTGKTRSHVQKNIDGGFVKVNGKDAKSSLAVKTGDVISYTEEEPTETKIKPVDIPIDIVYEDDDLAVINKPQGLTVHQGNGTGDQTLVNALLYRLDKLSGINGVIRPGIVHRIDKNTSGLLVVAKNDEAHVKLSKQIENKTCKRIYVALLEGVIKDDGGVIDTFIARDEKRRTLMAVAKSGRRAVTEYKVLKRYQNYTLCEFSLKTGRTHQIRVHSKYLGHPVVGDKEYGYKNQKFKTEGQLLHAKRLEFIHPRTGKYMTFEAPIPEAFASVLNKIK